MTFIENRKLIITGTMKKRRKTLLLLCTVLCFQLLFANTANAAYVNGVYISSSGACVMDYDTGDILYDYNGSIARPSASMSKLMNLYCIYEALAKGEISLDTVVPISEEVYTKTQNYTYQCRFPLNREERYTVNEMMGAMVTYSANNAAVAMAQLLANGNEADYVEKMNKKAAKMGINASFNDSYGLASNTMSPVATATLARNIISDYPDILTRASKPYIYFHGKKYNTTNQLLGTFYYAGADGLKTGTTNAAGYCLCATAVRNGRRIICVTMDSSNSDRRFIDAAALLDYGFLAAQRYDSIYFTDMRAFINDCEMPAFAYRGTSPHEVVIAEDLGCYGFDVSWNSTTKTLSLRYNKDKAVTPIPLEYYKNKNGIKAFSIVKDSNAGVIISDEKNAHRINDIYNVNGYICISVDELQDIYDFCWNEQERAAYIKTK